MAAVETKVQASTAAAAVSGLALWALGRYVFRGSGVPDVVASWVYVLTPGLITFAAGYLARHTSVAAPVPVARPASPAAIDADPVVVVNAAGYPVDIVQPPPPQGATAEKLGGPAR